VGAIPFFKRSLKKKNDAVLLQPRLRLFHGVRLATVLREREVLGRTKASTARPADHISHLSCADIQILHILPAGQHIFFLGAKDPIITRRLVQRKNELIAFSLSSGPEFQERDVKDTESGRLGKTASKKKITQNRKLEEETKSAEIDANRCKSIQITSKIN